MSYDAFKSGPMDETLASLVLSFGPIQLVWKTLNPIESSDHQPVLSSFENIGFMQCSVHVRYELTLYQVQLLQTTNVRLQIKHLGS